MKVHIQGMACENCRSRVEQALNGLAGVSATVDLKTGTATVSAGTATAEQLCKAVEEAGFSVSSVEE